MLNKIENCNYYSYSEGALGFLYYPESGMVKASNSTSTYRAVEYFAARGYKVDWALTNVIRNTLYITMPDYIMEEEALLLLSKTKEELHAQEVTDLKIARDKVISQNVDNTTGEVIKELYLKTTMGRLNKSANKTREDIASWFDNYNLEAIRPESPTINVSTKSKKTIINEGRGLVWQLFEKGELRKLTEDEYKDKMSKCT